MLYWLNVAKSFEIRNVFVFIFLMQLQVSALNSASSVTAVIVSTRSMLNVTVLKTAPMSPMRPLVVQNTLYLTFLELLCLNLCFFPHNRLKIRSNLFSCIQTR